jgi:hypothetical protein
LAEFVALRQEIERRSVIQHNTIILQVTLSGAVFAFALSAPGRTPVIAIVPVVSYMLWGRYLSNYTGSTRAATYIRERLSSRIPGGLGWEEWLLETAKEPTPVRQATWLHSFLVAFPGTSILALLWILLYVITSEEPTTLARSGLVIGEVIGCVLTFLTGRSVVEMIEHRSG